MQDEWVSLAISPSFLVENSVHMSSRGVANQGFLKEVSNASIELHKAGVWGRSPMQPLSNWKYQNYISCFV